MSELSLNEVESLALKVGRGAGFSWGLAEDIARAARALAVSGLPWPEALLALAREASSWRAPSPLRGREFEAGAGALCPVRVAARLTDDPSILRAGALVIANVGLPLWVRALLAASPVGEQFVVEWPGASSGGRLTQAADVTIAARAGPHAAPAPRRRARADDAVLAALGAVAARVYVPASEGSRARGAGGGSVDDE